MRIVQGCARPVGRPVAAARPPARGMHHPLSLLYCPLPMAAGGPHGSQPAVRDRTPPDWPSMG